MGKGGDSHHLGEESDRRKACHPGFTLRGRKHVGGGGRYSASARWPKITRK